MNDRVRWRIVVKGRVQGVGFRYSAMARAGALGISGHVKNMPDGNVHLEAEGPSPRVIEFYNWCRKGPPMAKVVDVVTTELPLEQSEDFRILR